jgi:hypothetical protein
MNYFALSTPTQKQKEKKEVKVIMSTRKAKALET